MRGKMKPAPLALFVVALLPLAAAAQTVEKQADGVIVRPADAKAADVRLQLVNDTIVRVSADPDGDFQRSRSLMRVPVQGTPAFEVSQTAEAVRLKARGISAEVALADGQVRFFDAEGKPLVEETAGSRTFTPFQAEGRQLYSVRQRFVSPDNESFYGTGLHQQGWMDLKGRDVELLQHNIDKAIPFVQSSRNYGILWDNNSITRFGDPRGLRPLGETLVLRDAKGKPGALTARYSIDGKEKVVRREEQINYQYIKDL